MKISIIADRIAALATQLAPKGVTPPSADQIIAAVPSDKADILTGLEADAKTINGLRDKYTPLVAGSPHLVNAIGGLRTSVQCAENHAEAILKEAMHKLITPPAETPAAPVATKTPKAN